MIKNYFKIALRNLFKNKVFTGINIFGLAIGFTCCLLISAFLLDELNFDKFKDSENIYRVELNIENKDFYSAADIAVGRGMKDAYPEISAFARMAVWKNVFIKNGNTQIKENAVAYVDSNFLGMFSIPFMQGNVANALTEPNSMVLSEEAAKRYFGSLDVLGKSLLINNDTSRPYKITGVIARSTTNLHFDFDFYVSFREDPNNQTWSNVGNYTYIKLIPGTDPKKLEAKFPELVAKHVVPEVQRDMGISLAEAQKSINGFVFYLKPVEKIHLYSTNKDELAVNGSIKYVYIFGALAFFIILLAAVNFTNLSTAASMQRSKEVGIRKVMGSPKKQLVFQFLSESILLSFFAYMIALVLIYFALPFFNDLSGKQLYFSSFVHYKAVIASLVFVLFIGILAGMYPAFFLSSFNIISVLKGQKNTGPKSNSYLRSGLVIFQFAVSIALIICTAVVYKQLRYMQNKELGFDKTQALVINDSYLIGNNQESFKQQLLQDSRVVSATISRAVPVGAAGINGTQAYAKANADKGNRTEIHIDKYYVDYDYLKTLGMQMKAGRYFSREFADSASVVLNESAVKAFGINGEPMGQVIVTSGQEEYTIVGVVKDFHYTSVKETIAPLVMMLGRNMGGMIVKINTADIPGLLASIKNSWNSYNPKGPFSYNFIDDRFDAEYKSEERTGKIFSVFALISIIIASLGLFGLSAYTITLRTKEIGVRKVLGASVSQVVLLLSRDFLLMVLYAFVLAVPVTWLAMKSWLQEFAYRIEIGWIIFAVAGIAAMLVAFTTVSFQAIKASLAKPVKSLRSE